eukprot:SAG25_NODE_284_length_10400_cov_5.110475_6_plen_97_part_00
MSRPPLRAARAREEGAPGGKAGGESLGMMALRDGSSWIRTDSWFLARVFVFAWSMVCGMTHTHRALMSTGLLSRRPQIDLRIRCISPASAVQPVLV